MRACLKPLTNCTSLASPVRHIATWPGNSGRSKGVRRPHNRRNSHSGFDLCGIPECKSQHARHSRTNRHTDPQERVLRKEFERIIKIRCTRDGYILVHASEYEDLQGNVAWFQYTYQTKSERVPVPPNQSERVFALPHRLQFFSSVTHRCAHRLSHCGYGLVKKSLHHFRIHPATASVMPR